MCCFSLSNQQSAKLRDKKSSSLLFPFSSVLILTSQREHKTIPGKEDHCGQVGWLCIVLPSKQLWQNIIAVYWDFTADLTKTKTWKWDLMWDFFMQVLLLCCLQLKSGLVGVSLEPWRGVSRVINLSESNLISGFCGRACIPTLSFLIPFSQPGGFMWVFPFYHYYSTVSNKQN